MSYQSQPIEQHHQYPYFLRGIVKGPRKASFNSFSGSENLILL